MKVRVEVPEIVAPPLSVKVTSHESVVVALFESDIETATVKSKFAEGVEELGVTVIVLKAAVPVTVKVFEEPSVYPEAEASMT